MTQDPHHSSASDNQQKKRLPIYILIVVGLFLLAFIGFMFADGKPSPSDAPPGHPAPNAQPAPSNPNQTTTGTATDAPRANEATATDQ